MRVRLADACDDCLDWDTCRISEMFLNISLVCLGMRMPLSLTYFIGDSSLVGFSRLSSSSSFELKEA